MFFWCDRISRFHPRNPSAPRFRSRRPSVTIAIRYSAFSQQRGSKWSTSLLMHCCVTAKEKSVKRTRSGRQTPHVAANGARVAFGQSLLLVMSPPFSGFRWPGDESPWFWWLFCVAFMLVLGCVARFWRWRGSTDDLCLSGCL